MYKRELKNTIKNIMMHDERSYTTLDDLIEIIIDIDDKLYKRQLKRRFDNKSREKASISLYRFVENDRKENYFDKKQQ